MTALTTKLGAPRRICPGESPVNGQLRAGTFYTVRPGSLLIRRDGSTLLEPPLSSSPRVDAVVVGVHDAQSQVDGTANADGGGGALDVNDRPILLNARTGAIEAFDTGASANQITASHIGRPCFAYDDNTLYLTDNGGTLPFAGLIGDVNADGKVQLLNNAAIRAMRPLFVEGGGGVPGVTQNGTVRAVITSLAANTESTAGILTADANGALGAQDGVTLDPGDDVYIPEGTTNLDSPEQAGPYTVITVGDGSTKFVLARPAWWLDGAVIAQASDVKVSDGTLYGGSTWRTFAAKGAVVGTDAPAAYPNYVAQQITLVAGTKNITNVPVKSASKVVVSMSLRGGTPAGTTTNYQLAAATAGALGTASLTVQAEATAGVIVNTDVSVLNVGARNW